MEEINTIVKLGLSKLIFWFRLPETIYKVKRILQGFIQALLLTSVFHERLSFMAIGHNPICVSMLAIATRGPYGALLSNNIFMHDSMT